MNILLDCAWKSTLLFGAAVVAERAMVRTSASVRHMVCTVSLVSALALSLVTLMAPTWNIPLPISTAVLARVDVKASPVPAISFGVVQGQPPTAAVSSGTSIMKMEWVG